MESKQYKHDRYLQKLDKHIEKCKDSMRYSSDRFDVLLISLSTSALVLSIGFVKNVIPDLKLIDTSLLKISWLMFVISLISNLVSQVTGYYSHVYDIKVTKNLIREERGKTYDAKVREKHKRYCGELNEGTLILNLLSLISLVTGIILLVLFFSKNI